MKPLKLTITGLQSFNTSQTIDFEKLLKYQMFGIFGQTASGKSTILDAITLSLYGEIVRNNNFKTTGLNQNINYNSDQIIVDFTFEVNQKTLRIMRRYSRKKNDPTTVESRIHKLWQITDQETLLADKPTQISEILYQNFKITKDDFYKSVILPQGQFSDFLKLKNAQRSEMLARIFDLNKYGKPLADKIMVQMKQLETQLLTTQSQQIDTDFPTTITQIGEENQLLIQQETQITKDITKINDQITKATNHNEKFDSYQKLKLKLQNHLNQQQEIQKLQDTTTILEKISSIKSELTQHLELNSKLTENNLQLKTTQTQLDKTTTILTNHISKQTQLQANIKQVTTQITNLNYEPSAINNLNKQLLTLTNQLHEIEIYNQITTQINEIQTELQTLSMNMITYEKQLKQIHIISDQEINHTQNQLQQINLEIHSTKEFLQTYYQQHSKHLINLKQQSHSTNQLQKINIEIKLIQEQITNNQAATLSQNLEPNTPCPVCGSKTHPKLAQIYQKYETHILEDLEKEKISLTTKTQIINQEIKNFQEKYTHLNIHRKITNHNQQQATYQIKSQQFQTTYETNNNNKLQQNKLTTQIQTIKNNTQKLTTKLTNLITQQSILNKPTTQQHKIKQQIEELNTQIKIQNEITNNHTSLTAKLNNTTQLQNDNNTQLEITKTKITNINQNITNYQQQSNTITKQLTALNSIINNELKPLNISLSDAINILTSNNDIHKNNQIITTYHATTTSLKQQIKGYTQTSKINLQPIVNTLNEQNIKHATILKKIGENQKTLTILNEQKQQQHQLTTQIKNLTAQHQELEQLYIIVAKNKFMNTLIENRLSTILITATEKIKQMTQGQYQLINHQNEFYVIDNFNNATIRSCHTLSGGETFIISLCLCLALSQHLQLKNNTKLDFFFLDEGFGSLDGKTLNQVMDILQTTKDTENITIGLITHVETIKNQVPIHLNVKKDKDNQTITNISY